MTNSKGDFEFFQLYNNNKKIYIQTSQMKVCEVYEHIMFCEFHNNQAYTFLLDNVKNMMKTKYENKFAVYGNKVKIKLRNAKIYDHTKKIICEKSVEPNTNITCILYLSCIWKNVHEKTWDCSLIAEQIMINNNDQCLFMDDELRSLPNKSLPFHSLPPPPPPPPPPLPNIKKHTLIIKKNTNSIHHQTNIETKPKPPSLQDILNSRHLLKKVVVEQPRIEDENESDEDSDDPMLNFSVFKRRLKNYFW
jgi:hypothetical protein